MKSFLLKSVKASRGLFKHVMSVSFICCRAPFQKCNCAAEQSNTWPGGHPRPLSNTCPGALPRTLSNTWPGGQPRPAPVEEVGVGGGRTIHCYCSFVGLQTIVYNSTLQQGSFSAGFRGTFSVTSLIFALLFALLAKWINFAHLPPVLSHYSLLSPQCEQRF